MNIEEFRTYCLGKPGVFEDFPFDSSTLVFKVGNKIFSLTSIDLFDTVNLKCAPEEAVELREKYEGIIPGYHMNKKHWNTIKTDGSVHEKLLYQLIDNSYNLVFNSLSSKVKAEIGVN